MERASRRWIRSGVVATLLFALLIGSWPAPVARAQLAPDVRDRVVSAAVVVIALDTDGNPLSGGSGTIIDPHGLVLTNYHVIASAIELETPLVIQLINDDGAVSREFFAWPAASDRIADLAVLIIDAEILSEQVVRGTFELPSISLGDSDALTLGDRLYVVGFPGMNDNNLTYTEGIVSGFRRDEDGISGMSEIVSDAVISAGSSGGTAVNDDGELVGIPTRGEPLECRQGDTNGDGRVDDRDTCRAIGGTVGFMRPSNLARPLLAEAKQRTEGSVAAAPSQPGNSAPQQRASTESGAASRPPASGSGSTGGSNSSGTTTAPPDSAGAIPAPGQVALGTLVPRSLALSPGQGFSYYDGGALSLGFITEKFSNPGGAQQELASLGWREGQYAIFAADNPPAGAAGWIEVHVHRFDTVLGAADGLPVLAFGHQTRAGVSPVPFELFADQSIALRGPAFNGTEFTLFARRGNLVFRVTGISPSGDPVDDVVEAILQPLVPLATDPRVATPEMLGLLPTEANLSPGFRMTEMRARSAGNTADTFANPSETGQLLQEWGWPESVSAVYTGQTANGSTRFETVVYRWRTPEGAAAAQDYFARSRAAALGLTPIASPPINGAETLALMGSVDGGTEASVYVLIDNYLMRYTAIGTGDPLRDALAPFAQP